MAGCGTTPADKHCLPVWGRGLHIALNWSPPPKAGQRPPSACTLLTMLHLKTADPSRDPRPAQSSGVPASAAWKGWLAEPLTPQALLPPRRRLCTIWGEATACCKVYVAASMQPWVPRKDTKRSQAPTTPPDPAAPGETLHRSAAV